MSLNIFISTLERWLVHHPTILEFSWAPGKTLASTPFFVVLAVLSYLSLTILLSRSSSLTPLLNPKLLKSITAVHSFLLLSLSLIMAVGCSLSIHSIKTRGDHLHINNIFCFPLGTQPQGPLFFWAHVFYLSKFLEFGDTALIILGGSIRRLSFLHVYHHATVVVVCYIWLRSEQSMFPLGIVVNSSVHVIMYAYYLLCAMGIRPKWKQLVTECQILQFVFGFVASGRMLYIHFTGPGCSGMWGWCFSVAFNASLLALFVDFHVKSYRSSKQAKVKGL